MNASNDIEVVGAGQNVEWRTPQEIDQSRLNRAILELLERNGHAPYRPKRKAPTKAK